MTDKPNVEPKQTTPKGVEIPVPKREDFLRDLKKVASPSPAGQPGTSGPRAKRPRK